MNNLEWFTDRVGSYIKRGTTDVYIDSEETAKKLFEVQSPEYTFTAKLAIHRKPLGECEACSA